MCIQLLYYIISFISKISIERLIPIRRGMKSSIGIIKGKLLSLVWGWLHYAYNTSTHKIFWALKIWRLHYLLSSFAIFKFYIKNFVMYRIKTCLLPLYVNNVFLIQFIRKFSRSTSIGTLKAATIPAEVLLNLAIFFY